MKNRKNQKISIYKGTKILDIIYSSSLSICLCHVITKEMDHTFLTLNNMLLKTG